MTPLRQPDVYGNWATLLLALDSKGVIDYAKLADEIDVLIDSRPNGIYSNGTAGEFISQSHEEFSRISTLLAEKCEAADIPFQLGISHVSPQVSIERLLVARDLQPGAVQLILPDWYPPSIDEIKIFFEKMMQVAGEIGLILYNPPHAKAVLTPEQLGKLKSQIPTLIGLKVSDQNRDSDWYASMRQHCGLMSVFVPGHHLATGITEGAHGAYSNMACLNPRAAQKWYELIIADAPAGLELEERIRHFIDTSIKPLIRDSNYSGFACDRFMALVGGWSDIGSEVRWPYRSIPTEYVAETREAVARHIPEFAGDWRSAEL